MTSPTRPVVVPPGAGRAGLWTTASLVPAAHDRPVAVAHLALRTTSALARDALALVASAGRLTAAELEPRIEQVDLDATTAPALAALALVWSAADEPARQAAGATAYERLVRQGLLGGEAVHHQGAGQSLFLAGRHDRLRELLPRLDRMPAAVRHDLETDLAHPAGQTPGSAAWSQWERLLSRRFVAAGLSPLTVSADGPSDHLFDGLGSTVAHAQVHGPLVTVVIPCWRPDEGLLSSVASITAQTYADLEVVIVDDASGPDHQELIEAAAALDERVRVVRLERNGGSYLARRAALDVTSAPLVTTQDADDWSHPQRIEHQVTALEADPQAPASRSLAVRAKDDLTHQWFGYRSLRDNASSLMVRREVMERVGTFLPIRKSADSEYAERLAALVGPVADTGSPLAVTRLRTGSLSRGDFTYQWAHPDRNAFRGTYRAWHRALAPVDPSPEVPVPFARGIDEARTVPLQLDVCLVGDLSVPPGEHPGLATTLLEDLHGRHVGLWHLERPRAAERSRPEMHPAWFDLALHDDHVHVVTRTHPGHVRTLVVLDPDVLLLAVAQPTAVQPDEVLLALDPRSTTPDAVGLPTDLLGVADAARAWWRRSPRWVVGPDADADALREELPGLDLAPWPWEGGPL